MRPIPLSWTSCWTSGPPNTGTRAEKNQEHSTAHTLCFQRKKEEEEEKLLRNSIYRCLCGSWLGPPSQGAGGGSGACPELFESFPLSLVMASEDWTANPHSVAGVSEGHNTHYNVRPQGASLGWNNKHGNDVSFVSTGRSQQCFSLEFQKNISVWSRCWTIGSTILPTVLDKRTFR
jgi:hypothetical protein